MSRTKRGAFETLRHYAELYATLLICGFLLVLKVLHVVDSHWVESAILATLMLLALSTIRDRASEDALRNTIDRLSERIGGEPGVRWYGRRANATADMLTDMLRFKHIAFLGVSQRSLRQYLQDRLEATESLPWETIEICFAGQYLGEAYEGAEFRDNVTRVRRELSALLTDPVHRKRMPNLERVNMIQHDGIVAHTGSLFGDDPERPSVVYVVHSTAHLRGDTHQGLTIRLEAVAPTAGTQDPRMNHYIDMYGKLRSSARSLGTFVRSLWDESAEQWFTYARQSKVLHASAGRLAEIARIEQHDSMLDIAAGSGETTDIILKQRHPGQVVVLDGSPQMAHVAADRFRNNRRVQVALCSLPARDGEDLDLQDQKFSVIVIHQSFRELVTAFHTPANVARWCREHLVPGGRVAIAAHNSIVETPPPPGFENWQDPFRERFQAFLRADSRTKNHIRPGQPPLTQGEVESAFGKNGFALSSKQVEFLDMTYEDRQLMWHVPAIMDSAVDVRQVGVDVVTDLIDKAIVPLFGQVTMPRTMIYWCFTRHETAR